MLTVIFNVRSWKMRKKKKKKKNRQNIFWAILIENRNLIMLTNMFSPTSVPHLVTRSLKMSPEYAKWG